MNQYYANEFEEDDFKLLTMFNSKLNIKQLGRTPFKYPTDASGYTKDNKYIEIELKRRNINIHTFKTIIIEPYKLQYAKEHADSIQLYVNFTNDDYIIVFNLHKITNIQKRQYNIPSKLYERTKQSFRYELPIQNAWIYKKQNNVYKCVKKGS